MGVFADCAKNHGNLRQTKKPGMYPFPPMISEFPDPDRDP